MFKEIINMCLKPTLKDLAFKEILNMLKSTLKGGHAFKEILNMCLRSTLKKRFKHVFKTRHA